jgi:LysR family nitrogen assimilation transcriptional regulator
VDKILQLRHLQYFVAIAEAGSFSRAAATIHVAQSALSAQIAELEGSLGTELLHRSARGVRPTEAGAKLLLEATVILRQLEKLPGIVRSTATETEGTVALGMSSTLSGYLAGQFMDACRIAFPRIVLRFTTMDSLSLQSRIQNQTLDIAVGFEDDFAAGFKRIKLFRQRLFLISANVISAHKTTIDRQSVMELSLILPTPPNALRAVVDRWFKAFGASAKVSVETDVFFSMLGAVRSGLGYTIFPKGNFSDVPGHENVSAALIEPPMYLTASIITSADIPLSPAARAVTALIVQFFTDYLADNSLPGTEPIIGGLEPSLEQMGVSETGIADV